MSEAHEVGLDHTYNYSHISDNFNRIKNPNILLYV